MKTGHRFFGDIFGKVWTDILYLVFVGISFIDLTLAFWEELKDCVQNDGGDNCGEDVEDDDEEVEEDEEEVHLADVVGDGGGGEVVDRQVCLAVPVNVFVEIVHATISARVLINHNSG